MHASQRDAEILRLIRDQGFVSFRQLCSRLDASMALTSSRVGMRRPVAAAASWTSASVGDCRSIHTASCKRSAAWAYAG